LKATKIIPAAAALRALLCLFHPGKGSKIVSPWPVGQGPVMEDNMGRKFIDCREFPSEMNCTVAISADTMDELVNAAVQHAVAVHGHQDTPEFRAEIAKTVHDLQAPRVVA
jgi:predicted small metal-binding protein